MTFVSGTWWAPIVNILGILPALVIRIGIPILVIILLVKGIKYLNKKNKE